MAQARRAPMNSSKLPTRMSNTVQPRQVLQVGRNEPCPCGSGKKYKTCHERDGETYLQKLAEDEAKKNQPPRPWYLRLLGL